MVTGMKASYFVFWQSLSFPIAYISANAYLNMNHYINQMNHVFGTNLDVSFHESGSVALMIFLILFMLPNVYVFISIRSLEDDLINNRA